MTNTKLWLKSTPAKTIILCLLILNLISLCALYSSLHQGGEFKKQELFTKQITWITISWLFLILISLINYRFYFDLSYILYGFNVFLLIAVVLFGRQAMGAQRWISFFGINFQPSELSKITTIFILARIFSYEEGGLFKRVFLPFLLIGFNALIIFKQPDLGTALIIIFIFFIMGLSSGIKKRYFVFLLIGGLLVSPLAWKILKDYQKKRLVVFLNPNVDPLGAGYTIIQSKIAIGSGRVLGKGFLSGTQNQFNFLPERHTDFIFTVIAEEWGFAGSIFILLIYWLILNKILDKTEGIKDSFGRLLCSGISAIIFLHVFINIGMTLGILPVVGLPLIFLSYGGTSMLVNFILLGVFINILRSAR